MAEFINTILKQNISVIVRLIVTLILILLGTLFLSTKGGTPKIAGKKIGKKAFLIWLVIIGILLLYIIGPFLERFVESNLLRFIDSVIPIILILAGIALKKMNKKMRADYNKYAYFLIFVGVLFILLELFIF